MDEDGFTLVKGGRQAKKRKAERSPQPYSPPGVSIASPSNKQARPKFSSKKNTIPVILSKVDPKFNTKVKPPCTMCVQYIGDVQYIGGIP